MNEVNDEEIKVIDVETQKALELSKNISYQFEKFYILNAGEKIDKELLEKCWFSSAFNCLDLCESKKSLLKCLIEVRSDSWLSLQALSSSCSLSIPLVSYHIRGKDKYKGLWCYGLVETHTLKNQLYIRLSKAGRKYAGDIL